MERGHVDAIVMGGSAGALEALDVLLPALPRACGVPVVIVLHLPPDKPSLLPRVLGARTPLPVKEAEDKEPLAPGTVYVAPPGYHLLIERARTLALSVDDPVFFSRPAIDMLFDSAADAYGGGLAAVLLSGANEDGARGLAAVKARGGLVVVQAPEEASVRAMPEAALAAVRPDHVLGLQEMAALLGGLAAARARGGSGTGRKAG